MTGPSRVSLQLPCPSCGVEVVWNGVRTDPAHGTAYTIGCDCNTERGGASCNWQSTVKGDNGPTAADVASNGGSGFESPAPPHFPFPHRQPCRLCRRCNGTGAEEQHERL